MDVKKPRHASILEEADDAVTDYLKTMVMLIKCDETVEMHAVK